MFKRNGHKVVQGAIDIFSNVKQRLTTGAEICKQDMEKRQAEIEKHNLEISNHKTTITRATKVAEQIDKLIGA